MIRRRPALRRAAWRALPVFLLAACVDGESVEKIQSTLGGGDRPDELPVLLTREPFRYPPELYAQRAQGNVVLRIFIDTTGRLLPESTRVEETSGFPSLDSAAVSASRDLRFVPAKRDGQPMPLSILFPIYYRHPDAEPLPGDTVLQRPAAPAGETPATPRP